MVRSYLVGRTTFSEETSTTKEVISTTAEYILNLLYFLRDRDCAVINNLLDSL